MKILVILFFAMLCSGLYAQSVIVNPDGTHSVVVDHGVHKIIVNPDGTHSVVVDHGVHKVIVKPDGSHSVAVSAGNSNILVNPDGTHSILFSQDDSQRAISNPYLRYQPFFIKKRGTKTIILPDGSVLHFKKVKQKKGA